LPKTDGVGDKNRPSLLDEPGCIDSEDPRPSYLSRLPTPIHQAVFEGVRISLKPSEGQASDLALQLRFLKFSESLGNHDSEIVDAVSVD